MQKNKLPTVFYTIAEVPDAVARKHLDERRRNEKSPAPKSGAGLDSGSFYSLSLSIGLQSKRPSCFF